MKKHFAKILLVTCYVLLYFISNAQTDSTKHKWSLGLEANTGLGTISTYNNPDYLYYNYNVGYSPFVYYPYYYDVGNSQTTTKSFSFGLKWNYYLKNNLSLKIRMGMKSNSLLQTGQDTGNLIYQNTNTVIQRSFYTAIGCQRDIHLGSFTNMYVGFDLSFAYYGNLTNVETSVGNIGTATNTLTLPGGITTGLGPVIGFTVNLCRHLGLNAEATDALLYEDIGGNETETGGSNYNHTYYNKNMGFTNSGVVLSIGVLYIH